MSAAEQSSGSSDSPRGPWNCGNCENPSVELKEAIGVGSGEFFVISHCVTCETTVGDFKTSAEIDSFESESDRLAIDAVKRQRPLSNKERLRRFDAEIEAFARALKEGHILPEDF